MATDEENMDVNQEAEATAVDSSADDQATVTTDEVTDSQPAETESEDGSDEPIPRSRFNRAVEKERARIRELEEQLEQTKRQSPLSPEEQAKQSQLSQVKAQLRELGFMTKEEFEANQRQARENEYVQNELSRLERQWDGKDGKPKFDRQAVVQFALENRIGDPEAAFLKMNMTKIVDWHNRSASDKSKGLKTEASDGSGSTQVGTSNADLKEAIRQGDRNALKTLLKRQL